jgi:hypothetical protein
MSINISIIPKDQIVSIVAINIIDINVILNDCANVRVNLIDSNNNNTMKVLNMSNEDYILWGTDDNYITNWVCSQLGFIIN